MPREEASVVCRFLGVDYIHVTLLGQFGKKMRKSVYLFERGLSSLRQEAFLDYNEKIEVNDMDFDVRAAGWDDEKRVRRAQIIAVEMADSVELKKDWQALEFGCGTGLISFHLQQQLKEITCIDAAQGMIDRVQEKIRQNHVDNMKAYCCDMRGRHPLLICYDLIYMSMALHHVVEVEPMLAWFYSVLKPDGQLCIVDLDKEDGSFHGMEKDFQGHNGFDQSCLRIILEEAGFEGLSSKTFYHDVKKLEGMDVPYSLFIMTGRKKA